MPGGNKRSYVLKQKAADLFKYDLSLPSGIKELILSERSQIFESRVVKR